MTSDLVFYEFSRSRVERCDFSHFLGLYVPEKLPTGRRLRNMMNSLVFGIQGYDDDPREIHSIPEVRRFYTAFHQAWPYGLYFGNLETDSLRMMTVCRLPSLAAMKVDGRPDVAVTCDPADLLRLISADIVPMNTMCERAGMFERLIYDRTKAVFEYFCLPFDSQPPPDLPVRKRSSQL